MGKKKYMSRRDLLRQKTVGIYLVNPAFKVQLDFFLSMGYDGTLEREKPRYKFFSSENLSVLSNWVWQGRISGLIGIGLSRRDLSKMLRESLTKDHGIRKNKAWNTLFPESLCFPKFFDPHVGQIIRSVRRMNDGEPTDPRKKFIAEDHVHLLLASFLKPPIPVVTSVLLSPNKVNIGVLAIVSKWPGLILRYPTVSAVHFPDIDTETDLLIMSGSTALLRQRKFFYLLRDRKIDPVIINVSPTNLHSHPATRYFDFNFSQPRKVNTNRQVALQFVEILNQAIQEVYYRDVEP